MTKVTAKIDDASAARLLRRAKTRQVEDILQEMESLHELRRWGFLLVLHEEPEALKVHAAAPARDELPEFEASLPGSRWWVSNDPRHPEYLATRLAKDLRSQWDRWVTGSGS